jgi:mRNA-degrading endonuclease RelE of RelBE toxin-antitoxin system
MLFSFLTLNTALPYDWFMLTIVESSLFSRLVSDYLSEEEYEDLKLFLALNPEAGDVIPGSGGLRKLRWIRTGTGKRGGVRVIYFLRTSRGEVALLTLYAKSRVGNLPPHIARQLKEAFENGQI